MNKLLLTEWVQLITAAGVIIAIIGNVRNLKRNGELEAADLAEMRSDIKYIKEKLERMENIPERVVAVEESAKQAHKRIDRLEQKQ